MKKEDRAREGKVWVGYFHVWEQKPDGARVRRKKEKTLGPATKPKHEALKELSDYIAQYTSEAPKQGELVSTFADLWQTFCAVQSGQWSKKTKENLQCLFKKHVLPVIGYQAPREVTLTTLQVLLNQMAERGYSKSAVGQVRVYLKACFEYATDEDVVLKNPARKITMPKIRKKSCGRFFTVEEMHSLLRVSKPLSGVRREPRKSWHVSIHATMPAKMHIGPIWLFSVSAAILLAFGVGRRFFWNYQTLALHLERVRVLTQVVISLLVLVAALYIILSKDYDPNDKHWAYGTCGTVLGYWLKG